LIWSGCTPAARVAAEDPLQTAVVVPTPFRQAEHPAALQAFTAYW
jgi:hypothetical protein